MTYTGFAIEQLKERLAAKSTAQATPRKYGNDMFEAREVIVQLQAKITAQAANEPLALEELRGMDGEPVYLVSETYPQFTGWHVAKIDGGTDAIRLWGADEKLFDTRYEYGDAYIAYRRPPEGSEDHES